MREARCSTGWLKLNPNGWMEIDNCIIEGGTKCKLREFVGGELSSG